MRLRLVPCKGLARREAWAPSEPLAYCRKECFCWWPHVSSDGGAAGAGERGLDILNEKNFFADGG